MVVLAHLQRRWSFRDKEGLGLSLSLSYRVCETGVNDFLEVSCTEIVHRTQGLRPVNFDRRAFLEFSTGRRELRIRSLS